MGSISHLNSAICCKFLTKSLQKLKKFKEFLRNSLNFPQNFQTLFTNSRKMLKHFLQKLAKFSNNSCKIRANFPQKFAQPKKLAQKTCSAHSPKKAYPKSSPKKLYQKSSFAQKSSPKKLTQKPTAKAYCKSCITYCWLVFACAIA